MITRLINNNRSYTPLWPRGIVFHSTATPGATAEDEWQYFNRAYRGASAHIFTDWTQSIQFVPFGEQAWHAGPTANSRYLGWEMCEPRGRDMDAFQRVWDNTVKEAKVIVRQLRFSPTDMFTHHMITQLYPMETNHTDPDAFLGMYNKTFLMLVNDIFKLTEEKKGDEEDMQPVPLNADLTKWQGHMDFVANPNAALLIGVSSGDAPGIPEPKGSIADVTIYIVRNGNWQPAQSATIGVGGPTLVWRQKDYAGQVVVDSNGPSIVVQQTNS